MLKNTTKVIEMKLINFDTTIYIHEKILTKKITCCDGLIQMRVCDKMSPFPFENNSHELSVFFLKA